MAPRQITGAGKFRDRCLFGRWLRAITLGVSDKGIDAVLKGEHGRGLTQREVISSSRAHSGLAALRIRRVQSARATRKPILYMSREAYCYKADLVSSRPSCRAAHHRAAACAVVSLAPRSNSPRSPRTAPAPGTRRPRWRGRPAGAGDQRSTRVCRGAGGSPTHCRQLQSTHSEQHALFGHVSMSGTDVARVDWRQQ